MRRLLLSLLCLLSISQAIGQVLYDNGPFYNSTGTGSGGANESVLYTTTFGMGTIGFGHQAASFNRVADDFTIADCRWRLDSIVFFGYQTGSTTTSTFTGVNFRIWNGVPDATGSTVVYGDTTTNRLTATRWSGAYRITETTTGATTRPIMRNVCAVNGLILNGGNFWIDWASLGSLTSGPWAPPRTPVGINITGNGRQRIGNTWNNAVDGGTGTPAQGFPFIIYGTAFPYPVVDGGPDQAVCPGNTALLGGNPTGSSGTGPLTFTWSPGTGLSNATIANPLAAPSSSTSYTLTVSDSLGCTTQDTVMLTVGATASNFLIADTTICFGTSITLDAGAGNSYNWSNGDTTQTISVNAGTYYVDVDNGTGCNSTDTVTVTQSVPVTIIGNNTICAAIGDTICTQAPYSNYIWSVGATTQCITVISSGIYAVTVVDANGCTTFDTLSVVAIPNPVAAFTPLVGGGGLTYTFNDASTDATSWSWSFGDGGTSTLQSPAHTYANNGTYTVTLVVSNACGVDSISQTIGVVTVDAGLSGATVAVSPNPAKTQCRYVVDGLTEGSLLVELLDLQGRVVAAWKHEVAAGKVDGQADLAAFARGVYQLRFTSGDVSTTRKLVLQ